jgi:hypothetical protein
MPRATASAASNSAAQGWLMPSPSNLMRVVRGLYGIFWGLMAAAFGATYLMMPLTRPMPGWVLLLGGALGILAGSRQLRQTRIYPPALASQQRTWEARTGNLVWMSILFLYFAVIFMLWREVRPNLYLFANTVGFFLTFAGFLVAINFLVPPLAHALSRQQLALEAQVFAATNIGLIMLPLLGTTGYVLVVSVSEKLHPLYVLQNVAAMLMVRSYLNLLVMGAMLLPFSLTLALVWTAKDNAIRALMQPLPTRPDPVTERDSDRP